MTGNEALWSTILREQGLEPVEMADTMQFGCEQGCWGTCCTGSPVMPVRLILDITDLVRLRRLTGLKTNAEVLERYCLIETDQGIWPLIYFRAVRSGPCDFLDQQTGRCSIYADRPNTCRSSPLAPTVFWNDAGELEVMFMKVLPHVRCQKANQQPAPLHRIADFLEEAAVDWTWSVAVTKLNLWAEQDLSYLKWTNPNVIRQLSTILMRSDEQAPDDIPDAEFYRRTVEAARYYLRFMAAYYGYGPDAGTEGAQHRYAERSITGAKHILVHGEIHEDTLRTQLEVFPQGGYVLKDRMTHKVIRRFDEGGCHPAEKRLGDYLSKALKKRQKVSRWEVFDRRTGHTIQATEFLSAAN